ncbi:MAG TPA: class I SAM-dependent methyltransferase [candidate division Zixibacteria bacterium]
MKNKFTEITKKMNISKILKENKRFWKKCFADSNFDFKLSPCENILEIIDRLKKYQAHKVLDLGCGFGRWIVALAQAGFQVKAVDISSEAIKKVQKWAEEEGLSIKTQVCSAQELVSENESLDAIICNSVLDHMPLAEAYKSMLNIKNVLKPGGIAYISFDGLEEDPKEFVLLNDGTRRYISGKRKGMLWRFYNDEEIKNLCEKMEILEFRVKRNGKREIWVRKKKNAE